ncbi:ParB/RepB/Spo0J family partition protein [Paenibacillus sp. NPDC058174]|uniref:ParB/RepB/Spo0J family partition protein n=1 Tax=Paenibacillus sp. NPDC058174 TaxID=3346366 RepID=UPI0036D96C53
MADIKDVIPNPLNPRTNTAIKTDEMQRVIREKGWEVPITCYQRGDQYIVLSGHRRLEAAKKLSHKKIPVYLVEAPKTKEEEQERLGSVQGGKTDWSVYEWAKHTYDMWIYWEKCSFSELARKMNKSCAFVSLRVQIFNYYPHSEIEDNLKNNKYSISILSYLMKWLNTLSRLKPEFVEHFKLEMIRTTMLSKIEKGLIGILDLKSDSFIHKASDEQVKFFLQDPNKKMSEALHEIDGYIERFRGKSKIKAYVSDINNANDLIKRLNSAGSVDEKTRIQEILNDYSSIILDIKAKLQDCINDKASII